MVISSHPILDAHPETFLWVLYSDPPAMQGMVIGWKKRGELWLDTLSKLQLKSDSVQ